MIADLSINYVERAFLESSHSVRRQGNDYGYDLSVLTCDEKGFIEPGSLLIQVKASERLARSGGDLVYDMDVRDYHLWMRELMPVYLILFDVSLRRMYWLDVQEYFGLLASRHPRKEAKTVRVKIPDGQRLTRRAVALARRRKLDLHLE